MQIKEFMYFCMTLVIVTLPMNYIVSKYGINNKIWKIPQGKKPGAGPLVLWLIVATVLQLALKTGFQNIANDPALGQVGAGIGLGLMIPFMPGLKYKKSVK